MGFKSNRKRLYGAGGSVGGDSSFSPIGGSLGAFGASLRARRELREASGKVTDVASAALDSPVCAQCGGRGWYTPDVAVGHSDFGAIVSCVCQSVGVTSESAERLRQYSNLGLLTKMTFAALRDDGWSGDAAGRLAFADALTAARGFAENPRGWLTIIGPSGTGKTHLAAAIVNALVERGDVACFIHVPDLLDELREGYAASGEQGYGAKYAAVVAADVVALDGLGSESSTPWAREKLRQVINARYVREMPTVITTSVARSDLDEYIETRLARGLVGDDPRRIVHTGAQRGALWGRPPDGVGQSFDAFNVNDSRLRNFERQSLEGALKTAMNYARKPGGWLVLLGNTGVGKTHLATAIAMSRADAGDDVVFAFIPELLDELRSSYESGSETGFGEMMRRLKTCEFLVLDDYGVVGFSDWAAEKIYQVVAVRHRYALPTVITTRDDLTREYGPTVSRMTDSRLSSLVLLDTKDYRARDVR